MFLGLHVVCMVFYGFFFMYRSFLGEITTQLQRSTIHDKLKDDLALGRFQGLNIKDYNWSSHRNLSTLPELPIQQVNVGPPVRKKKKLQ